MDYALQRGKGNTYETIQTQQSSGKDLCFEFTARAQPGAKTADPNLLGPFVQGLVNKRFVYIDIGTAAHQIDSTWSRRLKIPLTGITAEILRRVEKDAKLILETSPAQGKTAAPTALRSSHSPGGNW